MLWQDNAYLLSKKNYKENSIIIDIFTLNYGRYIGIVYGGTSRKIKKHLQVGNKIFVVFKSKRQNSLGYFTTELVKPVLPYYFDNKKKTTCILSALSMLNILLPERQINKKIFEDFESFIASIKNTKNWILSYIFWEQLLIKELGYETKPTFSITNKFNSLTRLEIKKALVFNRNLIVENFIMPNKLKLPLHRNILENYYN